MQFCKRNVVCFDSCGESRISMYCDSDIRRVAEIGVSIDGIFCCARSTYVLC